jgi:DNA-binding NtrC family response regulator
MALDSTSTSRPDRPCRDIRILLVDDDEAFRRGVAANLADDGHVVVERAEPHAVTAAATTVEADVAILDYEMPGMNGIAFADVLHAVRPALPILLVTAYWTADVETQIAARDFLRLCRKPLDYDTLHALVHDVAP